MGAINRPNPTMYCYRDPCGAGHTERRFAPPNVRPSHPDIIKLYDKVEEQLFWQFRAWHLFDERGDEELRDILRGYLVSSIGEIFQHSPYWNKEHPLYKE